MMGKRIDFSLSNKNQAPILILKSLIPTGQRWIKLTNRTAELRSIEVSMWINVWLIVTHLFSTASLTFYEAL